MDGGTSDAPAYVYNSGYDSGYSGGPQYGTAGTYGYNSSDYYGGNSQSYYGNSVRPNNNYSGGSGVSQHPTQRLGNDAVQHSDVTTSGRYAQAGNSSQGREQVSSPASKPVQPVVRRQGT